MKKPSNPEDLKTLSIQALLTTISDRRSAFILKNGSAPSSFDDDPLIDEENALFMGLSMKASSPKAIQLLDDVATMVEARMGSKARIEVRRAVDAIVADLITVQGSGHSHGYRSTGSDAFAGCPFKRTAFAKAAEALEDVGVLHRRKGHKRLGRIEKSAASVFTVGPALNKALANAGIDVADYALHFTLSRPIELRSATKKMHYECGVLIEGQWGKKVHGRPMKVDTASSFYAKKAGEIDALNAFAAEQTFTGFNHVGFKRIYNNGDTTGSDFSEGGRVYSVGGGHQQLSKDDRRAITINGESTVEIDISGSHPTIAAALMGSPIPTGKDIYHHPKVDRLVMKMFITRSIGAGSMPVRWDKEQMLDYGKRVAGMDSSHHGGLDKQRLSNDYPVKRVTPLALEAFPILLRILAAGWNGIRLQKIESDILVEAMLDLAINHNTPSLPVHDSLIVPASKEAEGRRALTKAFKNWTGAEPTLKLS